MSRRRTTIHARTEAARAEEAAARASAEPAVDWKLEYFRMRDANAKLQVRIAELGVELVKAKTTKAQSVPATALERAEAKLTAAQAISTASQQHLTSAIASTLPPPKKPRKPRAPRKPKGEGPAKKPRKSVRSGGL